MLRHLSRTTPVDSFDETGRGAQTVLDEIETGLLHAELHQALRDGLAELSPSQRELLLLLTADPPLSYRDISTLLDIPVGSIGPTRARCLGRLRATSALRELL